VRPYASSIPTSWSSPPSPVNYSAGDTIGVRYDVVDPSRASELGAPATSTPLTRGLVAAAFLVVVMAGGWLFTQGREDVPPVVERGPGDAVRGGRELQPQRQLVP
jgi:hypothetical protein